MSDEASSVLAALRRSHDLLSAATAGLDGPALRGPSYASEWTIAQVLSHLGSGAVIGKLNLDAGLADAPFPEMAVFQGVWDVWNAKTPEAQAADVLPADQALIDTYAAVPAETLTALQLPLGPMKLDGVTMMRLRLAEHALHTWDVKVALDPAVTVDADAVAQLVDGVGLLIGFLGRPGADKAVVHVVLTEPARELALTVGDAVTLAPWDGATSADATLTAPAEAFLRLAYGRLDAAHTPAGVSAEGIELDTLRAVFPGF
ncbi:maleylpyruvate isomerase family mycothiol-dependent enzyme [Pseudofrankia inefficax]|uniref:Mycothiol-dependent maleylpyruvate isomerase metal-binding domain-containing protein n=1 Tax=Pseudofrankia inefficax (strain DSM 45817 / CECT 9037 / DDB 130130 / EuI1c) TaxID=298654 RepID=E3JAH1_PSEI1|nr:maleylpyruvate isomerase family mycothiol-dependent enzyme [Pseudofrankia inefficax]ADP81022.1 protein of unknown function DUF1503 [Pseudofrankia inefficax]